MSRAQSKSVHAKMKGRFASRKGQLSIEAAMILLFMLFVLKGLWLGGPIQQSTEKSTDTNGIILAAQTLDSIASAVEKVGMGGLGERADMVIHMPFNAVDAEYGEGPYTDSEGRTRTGPHLRMTVLMYSNLEGRFSEYYVGESGRAWWEDPEGGEYATSFFYTNITKALDFPMDLEYIGRNDLYMCMDDFMKDSTEMRGPATRFIYLDDEGEQKPIKFCCEAGFNLHFFVKKSTVSDETAMLLIPRYYYSLPGEWVQTL